MKVPFLRLSSIKLVHNTVVGMRSQLSEKIIHCDYIIRVFLQVQFRPSVMRHFMQ